MSLNFLVTFFSDDNSFKAISFLMLGIIYLEILSRNKPYLNKDFNESERI